MAKKNTVIEYFEKVFYIYQKLTKSIEAYKLDFLKKQRICNILYVLLLEQDTTKKKRMGKAISPIEFDYGNSNGAGYKVEASLDSY